MIAAEYLTYANLQKCTVYTKLDMYVFPVVYPVINIQMRMIAAEYSTYAYIT